MTWDDDDRGVRTALESCALSLLVVIVLIVGACTVARPFAAAVARVQLALQIAK